MIKGCTPNGTPHWFIAWTLVAVGVYFWLMASIGTKSDHQAALNAYTSCLSMTAGRPIEDVNTLCDRIRDRI